MEKIDEQADSPIKLIFNYNNVFYSFFYDDLGGCVHQSREYAVNYVYSGEMILDNGCEQINVRKGECVFIPRDHRITMYKKIYRGKPAVPSIASRLDGGVLKLPRTVELASLFASMTPYFDPEVKPKDDFMSLKLQEGLMALMAIDDRFGPTLFDFNEPWKIDILEFMNENYMYEFSMEELAHYTGRSLATFKRDFAKISELTPQKWLMKKRLEVAYDMISAGNRKVVEVYAEVGFKNPSHFSTAFKKYYGVSPTAVAR